MWIRERCFVTSRGPDRRRLGSRSAVAWLVLSLATGGCVVTDKLEFHDAVNSPMSIVDYEPSPNQVLTVGLNGEIVFSATVWDPDVRDLEAPPIEAKLVVHSDWLETPASRCDDPEYENLETEEVHFRIECSQRFPADRLALDTMFIVEMIISDLGFDRSENPREGAEVSTANWFVRVEGVK